MLTLELNVLNGFSPSLVFHMAVSCGLAFLLINFISYSPEASSSVSTNQSLTKLISNKPFNIVTAGDFGCGKNANKTVNNMLSKQPEVVLALGDLSYRKSAEC